MLCKEKIASHSDKKITEDLSKMNSEKDFVYSFSGWIFQGWDQGKSELMSYITENKRRYGLNLSDDWVSIFQIEESEFWPVYVGNTMILICNWRRLSLPIDSDIKSNDQGNCDNDDICYDCNYSNYWYFTENSDLFLEDEKEVEHNGS